MPLPRSSPQKALTLALLCAASVVAWQHQAGAQEPVAIYKPKNDAESKVQAIFEKHCARCHQETKLVKLAKPAKGFGDVMQLDRIQCNTERIRPGNPDSSRIFKLIVDKEMPKDAYVTTDDDFDLSKPSVAKPSQDEISTLRTWIEQLGQSGATDSTASETSGYPELIDLMMADLAKQPDHRRAGTRYISLSHLLDACTGEAEMKVYTQGVVKLLNGLNRTSPDVVALETIDAQKSVLRIHIDDLGWDEALWDQVVSLYPYGVRPLDSQYDALAGTTKTEVPFIRGDWFAFFASRPPLYDTILKLPKTFALLQEELGVDVAADIEAYRAKRSGFQNSKVSKFNRLIERHTIGSGIFWTSYDFGGETDPRQSLFEFPLGPGGDDGFRHDGGESIFSLPNGFQAYYLNNAEGTAIDKGPINIVQDPARRDLSVTNGISCMGCHADGMIDATDEIRPHVTGNRARFDSHVQQTVEALYPDKAEMDKLIQGDRERFLSALKKAGLDPALKLPRVGTEMTNAISDRYERSLDLLAAAAEFGADPETFARDLAAAGGGSLESQLNKGAVPRGQFEREFGGLVEKITSAEFIQPSGARPDFDTTKKNEVVGKAKLDIVLAAEKGHYSVGEKLRLTVTTNRDCHLTLVNIDAAGTGTVIFPNKFSQRNLIKADQAHQFPPDKADAGEKEYDFKLSEKGTETVIAICDESGKALTEVRHDFDAAAFTDLGKGGAISRKIDVIKREEPESASAESTSGVTRTAIKLEVE